VSFAVADTVEDLEGEVEDGRGTCVRRIWLDPDGPAPWRCGGAKKIVIYGPTDSTLDDLVFGAFVKGGASAGGKGCAWVTSSAARAFAVANFWPHSGVIDAWRHPERLRVR